MSKLKLMTIVGTRPEIIRLSAVIKKCDVYFDQLLVHTGQNYDYTLNQIFFEDLGLRAPDHYLDAVGADLGETIGNIIAKSYALMVKEKPDALLILGDTNSCLSAISAKRLHIPISVSYTHLVDLVAFAFEHARPGDLFVQKSPASTIGDLAKAVQQLFGDTGTQVIGTRHGEKLFETLMTREERVRSEDMGGYYRVSADGRDLNYDKFVVKGQVHTQADESYTSHNTRRLDVQGTVDKILTAEYVQHELANWKKV